MDISGNDLIRLVSDQPDWAKVLAWVKEGQFPANKKWTVQFIAYQHHFHLLPLAVQNKQADAVRILLEHGANPNQRYEGETPLIIACENQDPETVEILLNAGANLEATAAYGEGEGGETALMLVAENRDLALVERLLKAGADLAKATSRKKQTAIWYATSYDQHTPVQAGIIRALLSAGCKLLGNELHWPVYLRDSDLVDLLLAANGPVNELLAFRESHGPDKGSTPLTLAVETNSRDMASGNPERVLSKKKIITKLLSAGANPNLANNKGQTPLLLAVAGASWEEAYSGTTESSVEIAKALLAAGGDPKLSPANSKYGSAFALAQEKNVSIFLDLFKA